MRLDLPPDWPSTEAGALAEQDRLRPLVVTTGRPARVGLVAGLDVTYATDGERLAAAVVVLDANTLAEVERQIVLGEARFPYRPGLLAFREIPALVEALRALKTVPDVLVADGYGIAHPRRFGLACHIGVLTGLPTIGVAKTAFVGDYAEPPNARGAYSDLVHDGDVVGRVLRTRTGVKPVFVSVGHRIDLEAACDLVITLSPRYRLPETTRAADHLSRMALAAD
ncbi:MAG TPA: deoxyribonuclease V [Actinocrinis sp.]|uniref:deoxyribonuclease V n=1 Tax=Actinocrinis sp. TaxID=1920516 RepID=UPI002DDCA63B|nr:deoxyribonuclease V [Actinocrinis sp.]HEV2345347.1 deoxyribonuclease V [Actinocrinis sp.]